MNMKTRGARENQRSLTNIAQLLARNDPDWLEARVVSKSTGVVFATKDFQKGDFIVNNFGNNFGKLSQGKKLVQQFSE